MLTQKHLLQQYFSHLNEIELQQLLTVSKQWRREILDHIRVRPLQEKWIQDQIRECCKEGRIITLRHILSTIDKQKLPYILEFTFFQACEGGHLPIVETVMKCGIRLHVQGIEYACRGGHMHIVNFFLSNIRPLSIHFNMGLLGACCTGKVECVKEMIKGARNVAQCIDIACRIGNREIVEILEKHISSNFDWFSCLYSAMYTNNPDFVRFILSKAQHHHLTPNDWNLLFIGAYYSNNDELIRMCLDEGAFDWNAALVGACEGGHLQVVQQILQHHHPLNLNVNNAFTAAAAFSQIEVCRYLKQNYTISDQIMNNAIITAFKDNDCDFLEAFQEYITTDIIYMAPETLCVEFT